MTKLFSQNSKMKATSQAHGVDLYNFGIPAFQSKTGLRTCPSAGVCAVGCYAKSGAYLFSNVAKAYESRLETVLREDAAEVLGMSIEALLNKAIKNKRSLAIRVHDSGDFFNPKYQLMWYHIARAFPEVQFYAYTKQVVQSIALQSKQPANFKLIYSLGGKQDSIIQSTDRHSKVFESLEQLEAAGYVDASHDDFVAIQSNNPKIGLVYHGAKNFTNTKWGV